jgi:hypothetical protein
VQQQAVSITHAQRGKQLCRGGATRRGAAWGGRSGGKGVESAGGPPKSSTTPSAPELLTAGHHTALLSLSLSASSLPLTSDEIQCWPPRASRRYTRPPPPPGSPVSSAATATAGGWVGRVGAWAARRCLAMHRSKGK